MAQEPIYNVQETVQSPAEIARVLLSKRNMTRYPRLASGFLSETLCGFGEEFIWHRPGSLSTVRLPNTSTLPLVKSARFMAADLTRHVVQLTCEVFDPCLSALPRGCRGRELTSTAHQLGKEAYAQSSPLLRCLAPLFSDETEPSSLTPAHARTSKNDTFVNTGLRDYSTPSMLFVLELVARGLFLSFSYASAWID
ncbi:hypothetical protein EV401DRAFT_1894806 [Pisolithus croceorrhizus]|nr:hypothetical protein EV401DRAFT_1894806 [Pisolithus croceorrhizus]